MSSGVVGLGVPLPLSDPHCSVEDSMQTRESLLLATTKPPG